MNQKLIKQVQDGTHCIESSANLEKLRLVLLACFPNDYTKLTTYFDYFYASRADKTKWMYAKVIPYRLTPIPLDDFFKEEEKDVVSPPVPMYLINRALRSPDGLTSDSVIERSLQASVPPKPMICPETQKYCVQHPLQCNTTCWEMAQKRDAHLQPTVTFYNTPTPERQALLEAQKNAAFKKVNDDYNDRLSPHYRDNERFSWAVNAINEYWADKIPDTGNIKKVIESLQTTTDKNTQSKESAEKFLKDAGITTALPEELVREHAGWMSDHKLHVSKIKAAQITFDYMGRFAECCESIVINNETWKRHLVINTYYWVKFVSPTVRITTRQLITLFFQSLTNTPNT